MPPFVPLRVKSHYSFGVGTASIPDLVQHAGRLGFRQLGLTDLANMHGQVQFHAACRAHGIQPLSGVELPRIEAPGASAGAVGPVVLLATDAGAYQRVCACLTRWRSERGASIDHLGALGPGVRVLAAEARGLRTLAAALGPAQLRALVIRPGPPAAEAALVEAARALGVPLVADLDAAMSASDEAGLQRLLRAVHQGCSVAELPPEPPRWLRAPREVERLFSDLPEALTGARALGDECSFDLLGLERRSAREAGDEASSELERRCVQALTERAPRPRAEYAARLATELRVIQTLGLTDAFVWVGALAQAARQLGIPLAARGSVVSSLVGHLLGLSPIDPVARGLHFERFAHDARRTPPDIDIDVASRRRDELMTWLLATRGRERTARILSLQTLQRRSAHRLGLRALGAPLAVVDRFTSQLPPDELLDAGSEAPPVRHLPEPWRRQLGLVARLCGTPRHIALHPGGVLLAERPVASSMPLAFTDAGARATEYDATSLAQLGLHKLDLLGSHCLDEQQRAWALASARGSADGLARSLGEIPPEDPATLALIGRGATIGCFQLESPAMRAVLAALPIDGTASLTRALALVRPGPASRRAKELFLARARGEAPAPPLPPSLGVRLADSHGLLLYEEDVSFVLATLSGISLGAAEALRVRLQERTDDRAWLERARARFVARAAARGNPPALAHAVWADVLRFVRYSFCHAHAASQARLAYQSAFLKCHAPLEFGCALLDEHAGLYPRRVIAAELARQGLRLWRPSLRRSREPCTIEAGPEGDGIRLGLGMLRGLRAETRRRALALQSSERPLTGPTELLARLRPSARELRALLWSGACDEVLGLREDDFPWAHAAALAALEAAQPERVAAAIDAARARAPRSPAPLIERYRALCRVQRELEHLRLYVTAHPMRLLRGEADRLGCVASDRLLNHVGERVSFAGILAQARSIPAGPGAAAQLMSLEDEHGLTEACLPRAVRAGLSRRVSMPGPFLFEVRVAERFGGVRLEIEALEPFHARPSAWSSG